MAVFHCGPVQRRLDTYREYITWVLICSTIYSLDAFIPKPNFKKSGMLLNLSAWVYILWKHLSLQLQVLCVCVWVWVWWWWWGGALHIWILMFLTLLFFCKNSQTESDWIVSVFFQDFLYLAPSIFPLLWPCCHYASPLHDGATTLFDCGDGVLNYLSTTHCILHGPELVLSFVCSVPCWLVWNIKQGFLWLSFNNRVLLATSLNKATHCKLWIFAVPPVIMCLLGVRWPCLGSFAVLFCFLTFGLPIEWSSV